MIKSILLCVATFLLISYAISYIDGYLVLGLQEHGDVQMQVQPTILFSVLILLIVINRRAGIRKLILSVILFVLLAVVAFFFSKPLRDKAQVYGFRTRIESLWNLEKLEQCTDSLVFEKGISPGTSYYKVFTNDDLPNCFTLFLNSQDDLKPKVTLDTGLRHCYISLEFELYSVSIVPSGFPVIELLQSIRKDRVFFIFSDRLNRSWNPYLNY